MTFELEGDGVLDDVPLFPLPGVVLFPRALLPLHIFEPRYRAMLADALAGRRLIAMAHVPERAATAEEPPPIARVAGLGAIVEHRPFPDGRSNVVLHGCARVCIEELPFKGPYRRARARLLTTGPTRASVADRTALVAAAGAYAQEIHARDPRFSFALPPNLDGAALADMCAHHLLLSCEARQEALEALDEGERVRIVLRELVAQQGAQSARARGTLH